MHDDLPAADIARGAPPPASADVTFRRTFLVLLVVAVSVAFVAMVREFVVTILLAAILTAISHPLYERIRARLGGRTNVAALVTIAVILCMVLIPLLSVLGAGAREALRVTDTVVPRLQQLVDQPGEFERRLHDLPGYGLVAPYRAQILTSLGDLLGSTGTYLFAALSATTRATTLFFFHLFVLLYTMFHFLKSGRRMLARVLAYVPLTDGDITRMLDTFVSVSRATLKGTLFIGIVQGALGGLAFWAAGIDGAVFWAMLMTVLSIVPGIGAALVWLPASLLLMAAGHFWSGLGLALFCALVVGSIDNLLRPRLVGQDTQMHELMIFFSTLGGLLLFGVMGFVLGPILAAMFITVWEMFGAAFRSAFAPPAEVHSPSSRGPT